MIPGFSVAFGSRQTPRLRDRGSQVQILSARQWGRSKNCLKEEHSREISGAFRVFWTRIGPGEAAASCFDTICSFTAGRARFGEDRSVRCAVSFALSGGVPAGLTGQETGGIRRLRLPKNRRITRSYQYFCRNMSPRVTPCECSASRFARRSRQEGGQETVEGW